MRLVQVAEANKKYYSKDFIHGFNTGAKTQYEADSKEAVRRGAWVGIDDDPCEVWECDRCGNIVERETQPNFCEECGADMREWKNG